MSFRQAQSSTPERGLTPNAVARCYGIGVHKVLAWIARGELAAVNVAADPHRRPQWSILPEALADFERRRMATPAAKTARAPRRKKETGIIEYF